MGTKRAHVFCAVLILSSACGLADDGDPAPPTDVPGSEWCAPVSRWPDAWQALEDETLRLVNAARATGGQCGAYGDFPPSAPLVANPALRCAARLHSRDMATRDYFDHVSPDDVGPAERTDSAGYDWSFVGENIVTLNSNHDMEKKLKGSGKPKRIMKEIAQAAGRKAVQHL